MPAGSELNEGLGRDVVFESLQARVDIGFEWMLLGFVAERPTWRAPVAGDEMVELR